MLRNGSGWGARADCHDEPLLHGHLGEFLATPLLPHVAVVGAWHRPTAISQCWPWTCASIARTSVREKTTGKRLGCFARGISPSQPTSRSRTSQYRNTMALIVEGERRLIQSTYTRFVHMLQCLRRMVWRTGSRSLGL
jgi:hypothetical protein